MKIRNAILLMTLASCLPSFAAKEPPCKETELYLKEARIVTVTNDNAVRVYDVTNYAEIGNVGGLDICINGLIDGVDDYWVEGKLSTLTDPAIKINPDQEVFKDEASGLSLFIANAQLIRTPGGVYKIVPARDVRNLNADDCIYISANDDGSFGVLKEKFSAAGNKMQVFGRAAFYKDESGETLCFGNSMETLCSYTPLDKKVYYPSKDSEKKTYEAVYARKGAINNLKPTDSTVATPEKYYGKLVNVVTEDDAVYISGLCGPHDGWLKGTLNGDKVIFDKGLSAPRSNKVSGVYDKKHIIVEEGDYDEFDSLSPSSEPFSLSFNKTTGAMTNDSSNGILLVQNPDAAIRLSEYDTNNDGLFWEDVIFNAVLQPFDDIAMTPQAPTGFTAGFGSHNSDWLSFNVNPFSTDGKVLDAEKLFYRLYLNGEPYTVREFSGSWEIPYDNSLLVQDNGSITVFISNLNPEDVWGCQTVYYGGNSVEESEIVNFSLKPDGVAGIDADKTENMIFDLQGRTADKDNLSTGIYVSTSGKKLINGQSSR